MHHPHLNWPTNVLHMGGGGGGGETPTQHRNDVYNNHLLQKQLADANKPAATVAPLTIPPAPVYGPPPSQTGQDTDVIANEARIAAAGRQGINNSGTAGGLGGDTGGFGAVHPALMAMAGQTSGFTTQAMMQARKIGG